MTKEQTSMRDINPFGLRMPSELREKVEEAAKENKRSLNAEILARLEESFIHQAISTGSMSVEDIKMHYKNIGEMLTELNRQTLVLKGIVCPDE